jgi:hypothetical protein
MRILLRRKKSERTLIWRIPAIGLVVTVATSLVLHFFMSNSNDTAPDLVFGSWQLSNVLHVSQEVEAEILDFFHGDTRALQDGTVSYASGHHFRLRMSDRMRRCRQESLLDVDECVLRIVFVGSAQMSGRDNLYNQTYPFVMEKRLKRLVDAAGLRLEVLNHAMDNDLSREGPQTCHMCILNLVGTNVDVVVWDFDNMANKAAQFEAFVRWVQGPALILVNNGGGPHGLSRRGTKQAVVEISPGHRAIVYTEYSNVTIEPRQEAYRNSTKWKQTWHSQGKVNQFWERLFQHYSTTTDFATIDSIGAIWHLDHLHDFSNMAFDWGKALPLVDCGFPGHPPPCEEIPQFIQNHLKMENKTAKALPNDTEGLVCGGKWGCRHFWYGGSRSHALRGEIHAMALCKLYTVL